MYIDLSSMKSGFCDRLRQITFCVAQHKLKKSKKKTIEIFEIINSECPYEFSKLLSVKGYKVKNVKKKNLKTLKMSPFNSSISINTCKEFNDDLDIKNSDLLQEWKRSYKLLEPKKNIISKINKIIGNKKYICIHTRLTDKLVNFKEYMLEIPKKDVIYKKQLQDFFNEISKIIPKRCKNIYLSSDESFFRDKLINILNNKYKIINRKKKFNTNSLRQTSGSDFIIDLFAMVNSESVISTTGGNVPLTSLLIAKKKKNYIKWTSFKNIYKFYNQIRKAIYFLRFFKF